MRAGATRVAARWLALRGRADDAARTRTASGLAAELERFLRARRPAGPVTLADVGAGTGAGAAWLHPRLALPQRWLLVDHDPDLLAVAGPVAAGWAERVVADLARLGDVLASAPADAVTCQALLDLLVPTDLDALLGPAVDAGAAVLAALTVTGAVRLHPAHPDDDLVTHAFNAHQRRAGRLGPDAGPATVRALRRAGYATRTVHTPWLLDGTAPAVLEEWLAGRASAAREQRPADADRVDRWLADRRGAARRGVLAVRVDHVDILAIPPVDGGRGVTSG